MPKMNVSAIDDAMVDTFRAFLGFNSFRRVDPTPRAPRGGLPERRESSMRFGSRNTRSIQRSAMRELSRMHPRDREISLAIQRFKGTY